MYSGHQHRPEYQTLIALDGSNQTNNHNSHSAESRGYPIMKGRERASLEALQTVQIRVENPRV